MSEPIPPSSGSGDNSQAASQDELKLQPADPPILPMLVCQKCGAANPPHVERCWLCEGSGKANPYSPASLTPQQASSVRSPSSGAAYSRTQSVAAILLGAAMLLTVIVGIGFAVQDTGMIVPYLIVVGPAFLATGIKALSGTENSPVSSGSLLFTFFWSIFMTIATIVLLVVAAIVLLFLFCLTIGSGMLHGPL